MTLRSQWGMKEITEIIVTEILIGFPVLVNVTVHCIKKEVRKNSQMALEGKGQQV